MNTTQARHAATTTTTQQSTLVTTHLEDLNISDQHSKQGSKPMIHGRKASTYLRVFDDEGSVVHDKTRDSSRSVNARSVKTIYSGMKSSMKASVDQRPTLKKTSSGPDASSSLDDQAGMDDLSLKPLTSASAIYFSSDGRELATETPDMPITSRSETLRICSDNMIPHIDLESDEPLNTAPESTSPIAHNLQARGTIATTSKQQIENKDWKDHNTERDHLFYEEHAIEDDDDDIESGDFPLAVELKPFTNKVGGHTAIFKFSERAVCKALVNRENNWYETIEKEHKELLQFMPRYIGVLNVRQHFHTKEDLLQELDHNEEACANGRNSKYASPLGSMKMEGIAEESSALPEVVLDDNKHIIPNSLIYQYSNSRSGCNSPSSAPSNSFLISRSPEDSDVAKAYGTFGSGSTTINTKLQELVVKEAFMKRKSTDGHRSPRLARVRTGSSSSLKDRKFSRSSSSSSNKMSKVFGSDAYPRRGSLKRGSMSTGDNVTLRQHSLDFDDDAIFKLDDEQQAAKTTDAEQEFTHESVSVEDDARTIVSKFILLEDLTRKLKCPCVLDLKMGTRQYGVDAKRSKQLSQRKKCNKTTSRKLGVRICGLKIWDKKNNYYIARDKYFGRRVKIGWQFTRVLGRFLYDGKTRTSIIKQIPLLVRQLDTLFNVVSKLHSYRLYGSSLLLFYDGDNPSNKRSRVKVNIIDFARCVTDRDIKNSLLEFKIPPHYPDREDQGFLRGVRSLKFYLLHLWNYLTNDNPLVPEGESLSKFINENEQQFEKNWDWLDEFDREEESKNNNEDDPLRVKWRKYELIFGVEPRYLDDEVSD